MLSALWRYGFIVFSLNSLFLGRSLVAILYKEVSDSIFGCLAADGFLASWRLFSLPLLFFFWPISGQAYKSKPSAPSFVAGGRIQQLGSLPPSGNPPSGPTSQLQQKPRPVSSAPSLKSFQTCLRGLPCSLQRHNYASNNPFHSLLVCVAFSVLDFEPDLRWESFCLCRGLGYF